MLPKLKVTAWLLLLISASVGSFAITRHVEVNVRWRGASHWSYAPGDSSVLGPQLWFVYLGNSTCGWSNNENLPAAVKQTKQRLAAYADSSGATFKAVAVALDYNIEAGLAHISKFGRFDEVSVGDHLTNVFATDYFSSMGLVFATPQIAVYEVSVGLPRYAADSAAIGFVGRTYLGTARGLRAILHWAESGLVLPPGSKMPTVVRGHDVTNQGTQRTREEAESGDASAAFTH